MKLSINELGVVEIGALHFPSCIIHPFSERRQTATLSPDTSHQTPPDTGATKPGFALQEGQGFELGIRVSWRVRSIGGVKVLKTADLKAPSFCGLRGARARVQAHVRGSSGMVLVWAVAEGGDAEGHG